MAGEIVAGPPTLGGLGFMDLYIEQGLLNLQLLTKALSDSQLVGDLTWLTIRKWKWQLGTGNDPFQDSQYQYPQDESKWLQSVRHFAVRYHIRLSTVGYDYPLQRLNDKYIMEWAKEMGFSHFELRFLNH